MGLGRTGKTIGGEEWAPRLCGECREYNLSLCRVWKQYKSARGSACSRFLLREKSGGEQAADSQA
jgi:hypothetical protein